MQAKSDAELLAEYANLGREAAFAELVQRHTDLVYSSATDSERAEWQKPVQILCDRRHEFREHPAEPPLIVCEF